MIQSIVVGLAIVVGIVVIIGVALDGLDAIERKLYRWIGAGLVTLFVLALAFEIGEAIKALVHYIVWSNL